ncbi:MAG: HEAT repeat domain-containing protein, partial [Candidatus Heimdallarchaeota archaeon]
MAKDYHILKLIDTIRNTSIEKKRFEAINELGYMGKKAKLAIPTLIETANRIAEGLIVRAKSIWSLGEIGLEDAVDSLIHLLQTDTNKNIRILSLSALGKIGKKTEVIIPSLQKMIESEELPEVRNCIPKILGKCGREAIPILINLIESSDANIKYHSILALGEIQGDKERVISYLNKQLESANEFDKINFTLALLQQEGIESEANDWLEEIQSKEVMTFSQQSNYELILERLQNKPIKSIEPTESSIEKEKKVKRPESFKSDVSFPVLKRINKVLFKKEFDDHNDFLVKNYQE